MKNKTKGKKQIDREIKYFIQQAMEKNNIVTVISVIFKLNEVYYLQESCKNPSSNLKTKN